MNHLVIQGQLFETLLLAFSLLFLYIHVFFVILLELLERYAVLFGIVCFYIIGRVLLVLLVKLGLNERLSFHLS